MTQEHKTGRRSTMNVRLSNIRNINMNTTIRLKESMKSPYIVVVKLTMLI